MSGRSHWRSNLVWIYWWALLDTSLTPQQFSKKCSSLLNSGAFQITWILISRWGLMKTRSDLLLGALAFLKCVLLAASANFRSCVLEMPVVATYLIKLKIKGLFTPWKIKKPCWYAEVLCWIPSWLRLGSSRLACPQVSVQFQVIAQAVQTSSSVAVPECVLNASPHPVGQGSACWKWPLCWHPDENVVGINLTSAYVLEAEPLHWKLISVRNNSLFA